METPELDYCDRCGMSIPPKYLKSKNDLMLCPECFREAETDYSDSFDLFTEMKHFDPHVLQAQRKRHDM